MTGEVWEISCSVESEKAISVQHLVMVEIWGISGCISSTEFVSV